MSGISDKDLLLKWADLIYSADEADKEVFITNRKTNTQLFRYRLAEYLHDDMRRAGLKMTAPFSTAQEFHLLPEHEKHIWYNYVTKIPDKLKTLNLFIRPYREYCRTCIITEDEISRLASFDNENFMLETQGKTNNEVQHSSIIRYASAKIAFSEIPGARKWFYIELNYLIPPQVKKIGYEIIRSDEITSLDSITVRKLSRAIHSRYLQEKRKSDHSEDSGTEGSSIYHAGESSLYNTDYDNLPDDIKISNKDNAFHIPAKLLAIGYRIRHVQKGFKPLTLRLNSDQVETMARIEHLRWSWDKRLNGWLYGNIRDDAGKIHPGLIPFEELSETEKEKDRELVRLIPALLHDIDYEAYPVNTDNINLSYSIKPHSSIHKLLDETHRLNEEIRERASEMPEIIEKISIINSKICETINEVQGSYNYAHHIQKTFLPDDLYIRECFPDSFVLLKPKDIVGGDFYFFSHSEHRKIFAAADCTGHGIPGAMLSTIGYGITDQAVNELGINLPSEILKHLYSKVHSFLRWDEDETGLSDDMDIVMCYLDEKSNLLTYSSVRTPFYHIRSGTITEYPPLNYQTRAHSDQDISFESGTLQLEQGDTIYLCSDGFTDQFGGLSHRKYSKARFRTFLLSISDLMMTEQSDRLYEEIEHWREENNEDQTDDILVIGIRI